MLKRSILILLLMISFIFADEFIVESFNFIENDLFARKYAKYDVNNRPCALVKVKMDIEKAIQFDSNVEMKTPGEYYFIPGWVSSIFDVILSINIKF